MCQRRRMTHARRCVPMSRTWTPLRTWAGSRSAGSSPVRSARASRPHGAVGTAPSSGSGSPSCTGPRRLRGCRPRQPRRAAQPRAPAARGEPMGREGYELTVGRPTVVTREVDGKLCEPVERLTIDVPEEYLGAVTTLLAVRKGRLEQMTNHGSGWIRLDFMVPARGLIGLRTQVLPDTRGP